MESDYNKVLFAGLIALFALAFMVMLFTIISPKQEVKNINVQLSNTNPCPKPTWGNETPIYGSDWYCIDGEQYFSSKWLVHRQVITVS